jgi:gamma-glutamylaminecyclotransferase
MSMLVKHEPWDTPTKKGETLKDMRHRVFVYGTLKYGQSNNGILQGAGAEILGHTRVPDYVLVNMGQFPGAVKLSAGGWQIYGEVWECDDETLHVLDRLEGHPEFYKRVEVEAAPFGKVFMYELPPSYLIAGAKFFPQGRWDSRYSNSYLWDESRARMPYQANRPLIEAPKPSPEARADMGPAEEPKALPAPEVKPENPLRVGPGWEEA